MLVAYRGSFPPASEREARMDDPTRRWENDTGNGIAPSGALVPKQEPHFLLTGKRKYVRQILPGRKRFREKYWSEGPVQRICAHARHGGASVASVPNSPSLLPGYSDDAIRAALRSRAAAMRHIRTTIDSCRRHEISATRKYSRRFPTVSIDPHSAASVVRK